ncbi:MAG: SusD/RagB family nutrient-binding outer membrane lipoprotein [Gemmatimonadetes bacterium]|nr:SusD/RagB family nutrient-binding outer membrane lipoprotein [Gemmatimonadota bacterium]
MTINRENALMNFNQLSVALVAASLAATACKTDLTGLNTNPNSPTTAPAASLFSNATAATLGRWNGSGNTLSMTSLFAQHVAQVQYVDEDRGHIRPTTVDGFYSGAYTAEMEDYQKVQEQGKAANNANLWGPAVVMQSWVFQNVTDILGDIPYSEALKGDAGGSLRPKYDSQKDIYYGLLKTLTDAAVGMKASTGDGFGSADLIYKGDASKWVKFANSLRARLALRMSNADAAKAAAELSSAFAGGVMTSNADNAMMAWPGDGVFDNPWAASFATRDDHRVSKTLLDTMNVLGDPRVKVYAQPTKADATKYTGLQNGMDNVTVTPFFNTTSRPGAIFYPGITTYGTFGTSAGKKTPSYILTYAEVEFMAAEAAERGLGGQTGAAAHYNAGVTASIKQWGGSDAAAAAYLAQPGVAYVAGAEGLKRIGLQKWISLFTQGTEAWSEWRRTGNPATIKMGPSAYPDVLQVPRRLLYPSNEQSVNATSLAEAIARQGPDLTSTRVWWNK